MKTHTHDTHLDTPPTRPHRHIWNRILWWTVGVIGSLIILIFGGLAFATWYFDGPRLAQFAERQAGKYLDADVKIGNADFTLWSTFPHLQLNVDSVEVISKSLDNVTLANGEALPDSASFLTSFSHLKGGINVLKLLAGKVALSDVNVSDLRLNLFAVSDSVANYLIVKEKNSGPVYIPSIYTNLLSITNPQPITYTSLATDTRATLQLEDVTLRHIGKRRDDYNLRIAGIADATLDADPVLTGFPFLFSGDLGLDFHPFELRCKDYTVNLGEAKAKVDLDMEAGNDLKVNDFKFNLAEFNPAALLQYLPPTLLPAVDGLKADFNVEATARLTKPYVFTAETLPSFEVNVSSPDGFVSYTTTDRQTYRLRNDGLRASLVFNGDSPSASYLDIPGVDVSSDGFSARISGRIANIYDQPRVSARVEADADAARLRRSLSYLKPFGMAGKVHVGGDLTFTMDSLTSISARDIAFAGNITSGRYNFAIGRPAMKASGNGLTCKVDCRADELTTAGLYNALGKVTLLLPSLTYRDSARSMKAKNLTLNGLTHISKLTAGTLVPPVKLDVRAQRFNFEQDTIGVDMDRLRLSGTMRSLAANGGARPDFRAKVSSADGTLRFGETSLSLTNLQAAVDARKLKNPHQAPTGTVASPDQPLLDRVLHTPEYLAVNAPAALRDFFAGWDVTGEVKARSGQLLTPAYPVRNYLKNVDIAFSLDSVSVNRLNIISQTNRMELTAALGNLRNIVLSPDPQPIRLDLDVALDTINCNSVAGTYEAGVRLLTGKPYYTKVKHSDVPMAPSDSVTMLIPRNIDAHIHATAKETVYTNLHLYDLNADVDVSDGHARVSDLNIAADFGRAGLTCDYNTADLRHLGLQLGAHVDSIDVVRFFQNFHQLLVMMPQMKNLSGYISAEAEAGYTFFPDMYLNVPSVAADVNVQGRDLCVHQDDFIRHITRMLLIHNSGDLHIHDMDVHATVHDNLLELYPFDFQVEDYSLNMLGLNNFNGDMYYHIGVDRWPLHIPFGINIKGNFHHPQFRFGGEHYADNKAWDITSGITGNYNINMMHELKYYLKEFVHKAAESSTAPQSDIVFPLASR